MNIGPLSKNHMKIFDRNFKKESPKLPQVPMFASIKEQLITNEEGEKLRQHYLDADFTITPERISKMAETIVERLHSQQAETLAKHAL